ncbi:MAG TPA: SAM-dependent chlorinase/fluorinase [Thermoleophilia bacterium]|nr:SAM-dependent chlorinase/fluorinase [Thermoleophilia bacterium]
MSESVNHRNLITFLTDFGLTGGYVAACEATILSIAPHSRVLHLSHELELGDVRWGSTVLARVAPLGPICIHLAVVDPGVGTERHPVVLIANRGDILVGPDNGLLIPAIDALGGLREAWLLQPGRLRARAALPPGQISSTFHARDVFAPAAALVSAGTPMTDLGVPLDAATLVRVAATAFEANAEGLLAEVLEVDRFGNVGLSARFDDCPIPTASVTIEVVGEGLPDWNARVVRTFGELGSGELGVYRDAWGQVALALNGASAAELLAVDRGMVIRITPRDGS